MSNQVLRANKLNKLNKKYQNLLLEEKLLNYRLADILRNFNSNAQNSRSFRKDTKLIKQAENRLLEISIEIDKILSEILDTDLEKMSVMHSPPIKPARAEGEMETTAQSEVENLATGSAATSTESIVTAVEAAKPVVTGAIPKNFNILSTPSQSVYTHTPPVATPRFYYNPNSSYDFPSLNETAEERKARFKRDREEKRKFYTTLDSFEDEDEFIRRRSNLKNPNLEKGVHFKEQSFPAGIRTNPHTFPKTPRPNFETNSQVQSGRNEQPNAEQIPPRNPQPYQYAYVNQPNFTPNIENVNEVFASRTPYVDDQQISQQGAQPRSHPRSDPQNINMGGRTQENLNSSLAEEPDLIEYPLRAGHNLSTQRNYLYSNVNPLNVVTDRRQAPNMHFQPYEHFNENVYPNLRSNSHPNLNTLQEPQGRTRARETFLRRLRVIPKFNGEKYQDLRDFIDIVDSLYYSAISQIEIDELYEQIILQLRGEAKFVILNLVGNDWPGMKENLLEHFSYLSNQNILTSQLENLHQEKNESLSDYANRARTLLKDKNATYTFLSNEQRLEHNRLARRAFSRGISEGKLRDRLLTRGASSLEDAIAYAIEAENDALNLIPNHELYCRSCKSNGHRERDCKHNSSDNTVINSFMSALKAFNGRSNSNFTANNNWRNNNRPNNGNFWNRNPNGGNNNRNWNANRNESNSNRFWNMNQNEGNSNRQWNANRNENAPQKPFQRNEQNKNGQANQKRTDSRPNQNNFGVFHSPQDSTFPLGKNETEN